MVEEIQIEKIPIDKIKLDPKNPRGNIKEENIKELAESIEGSELQSPINIRKIDDEGYEVISGNRRLLAFKELGLEYAPSIVREANDIEAMEMGVVENWQREDLSDNKKEQQIYDLWTKGKKEGRYDFQNDMSRKTGIPPSTLNEILESHGVRKQLSFVDEDLDEELSYQDIARTRLLKDDSELREKVLEKRIKKNVIATDLRKYSKKIKEISEQVNKETALEAIEQDLSKNGLEKFSQAVEKTEKETGKKILDKIKRGDVSEDEILEFTELVKKADEESKEMLFRPGVSMSDIRMRVSPEIYDESQETQTVKPEDVSEEEKEKWRNRRTNIEGEIQDILDKEETKKKKKLRQNWQSLQKLATWMDQVECPVCGKPASEHMTFDCHGLTAKEALKESRAKYQKSVRGGENSA